MSARCMSKAQRFLVYGRRALRRVWQVLSAVAELLMLARVWKSDWQAGLWLTLTSMQRRNADGKTDGP
jgi:hypothetical protein